MKKSLRWYRSLILVVCTYKIIKTFYFYFNNFYIIILLNNYPVRCFNIFSSRASALLLRALTRSLTAPNLWSSSAHFFLRLLITPEEVNFVIYSIYGKFDNNLTYENSMKNSTLKIRHQVLDAKVQSNSPKWPEFRPKIDNCENHKFYQIFASLKNHNFFTNKNILLVLVKT